MRTFVKALYGSNQGTVLNARRGDGRDNFTPFVHLALFHISTARQRWLTTKVPNQLASKTNIAIVAFVVTLVILAVLSYTVVSSGCSGKISQRVRRFEEGSIDHFQHGPVGKR